MKRSEEIMKALNEVDEVYLAQSEKEKKPWWIPFGRAVVSFGAIILVASVLFNQNAKNAVPGIVDFHQNEAESTVNNEVHDVDEKDAYAYVAYKVVIKDLDGNVVDETVLEEEAKRLSDFGFEVYVNDGYLQIFLEDINDFPKLENYEYEINQ